MKRLRNWLIAAAVGVMLTCICLVLVVVFYKPDPETAARWTAEAVAGKTEAARPSDTPGPTSTAGQTNTPAPTDTPAPTNTPVPMPTDDQTWMPLLAHVYSGVKMYYGAGEEKAYGFEILGGNDNCPSMPSGRGLYVQYEDGTLEWKDRQAMVQSPYNFVRRDDPALEKIEWFEYPCQ